MGKSVAETKSKKMSESSSEASASSEQEESSSEEEEQAEAISSAEEEEEMDQDSTGKRSHSSSEEEEEEEERPKKVIKVEEVQKKAFGAEGVTVWVGQINFDAKKEDIQEYFSQCGEVAEVRLRTEPGTGRSRGFAHIDFSTEAGKKAALELDGTEFMGRTIKVDNANVAKPRGKDNNFGPKSNTVFVANLAHSLDEDDVRQAFEKFGTIVGDIRLPYNRETGKIRGIGYIQFETEDEAEAAVKGMNGISIEGRPVRTDFSGGDDSDRVKSRPARGGFGGRGRGGNRGRGGFGGRGRGGDRGGRGRGGRGRN